MEQMLISLNADPRIDPHDLSDFYGTGFPPYADYTRQMEDDQLAAVTKEICRAFPFCTQGSLDEAALQKEFPHYIRGDQIQNVLYIDHAKAKAFLLERYAKASELFRRLANGEQFSDVLRPYEVGWIGSGHPYGMRFLYECADITDLGFIRKCAQNDADRTLFVARAWEYK